MKATIDQEYYDSLIDEINLLQELLTEANNRIAELENKLFKPIKDMDYLDWMIACRRGYKFKTRGGEIVTIIETDDEDTNWPIKTDIGWCRLDGTFDSDGEEVPEDIVEHIS